MCLCELLCSIYFSATWQAIRDVFPTVIVKGCVFHWTQRIYKKLSQLGLSTAYTERKDKHAFLRKLMSLPFLPQEHIIPAFNELKQQAASTQLEPFIQLTNYIQATWIEGLWTPVCWSVFRETVRTNNEVEGIYLSIYLSIYLMPLYYCISTSHGLRREIFFRISSPYRKIRHSHV